MDKPSVSEDVARGFNTFRYSPEGVADKLYSNENPQPKPTAYDRHIEQP